MSNLTPTTIVDKNGIVTVRHKKKQDDSNNKAVIPTVSMPPSPQKLMTPAEQTEANISELLRIVTGDENHADYRTVANLMHEDDKTTIPLALSLLNSGSDKSRLEAKWIISHAMDLISGAYAYSDENDLWRDDCASSFSPTIKHKMMAGWNVGSFMDRHDVRAITQKVMQEDYRLHLRYSREDRSANTDYWRGLTIMTLNNFRVGFLDGAKEFASWIGQQEDYEPMVQLAKERNTYDVAALTKVMDEQDKTANSLRSGTL